MDPKPTSSQNGAKPLGWGWSCGAGFTPVRDAEYVIREAHMGKSVPNKDSSPATQDLASKALEDPDNLATPSKKRSSSDRLRVDQNSASCPSKVNVDLLKLLFAWGKEYCDVESVHLYEFVKGLCPSYSLPSTEQSKDEILKDVKDNVSQENSKIRKSNTLHVQHSSVQDKNILVSCVIGDGQYISIGLLVTSESVAEVFEKFCRDSCLTTSKQHQIRIYSIIHNTSVDTRIMRYAEGHLIYFSKTFSILIDDLEKMHTNMKAPDGTEDDINNYCNDLNNLRAKLTDHVPIGSAIKLVLDLYQSQPDYIAEKIHGIVQNSLNPLVCAAMFLNPNHKHQVLPSMCTQAHRYLTNIVQEFDSLTGVTDYMGGKGVFESLLSLSDENRDLMTETGEIDVDKFWRVAHITHQDLGRAAYNILIVPATPKSLDSEKLTRFITNTKEFDTYETELLLCVLTEEL